MSITPTPLDTAPARAAARLLDAARTGIPCAPVRDLLGPTDIATAYAVQRELTRLRTAAGARVVGRKIGLTAPAVQAQLGVDQPDFGVLFDDMDRTGRPEVATAGLRQARVEAEIAFVLGADLAEGPLDARQVRAAVAHQQAALEIVDCRIADWDISIVDTVADNAASALFVLSGHPVDLAAVEPATTTMELSVDDEVVVHGSGAACLGDPLAALTWLARTARDYGDPLRAGQIVLSGALGPMIPIPVGRTVSATVSGLGTVRTRFVA